MILVNCIKWGMTVHYVDIIQGMLLQETVMRKYLSYHHLHQEWETDIIRISLAHHKFNQSLSLISTSASCLCIYIIKSICVCIYCVSDHLLYWLSSLHSLKKKWHQCLLYASPHTVKPMPHNNVHTATLSSSLLENHEAVQSCQHTGASGVQQKYSEWWQDHPEQFAFSKFIKAQNSTYYN